MANETGNRLPRRKRHAGRGYQVVQIDGYWIALAAIYDKEGYLRDVFVSHDENGEIITHASRIKALESITIAEKNTEIALLRQKIAELEAERQSEFQRAS